jgi:hypothetical protein
MVRRTGPYALRAGRVHLVGDLVALVGEQVLVRAQGHGRRSAATGLGTSAGTPAGRLTRRSGWWSAVRSGMAVSGAGRVWLAVHLQKASSRPFADTYRQVLRSSSCPPPVVLPSSSGSPAVLLRGGPQPPDTRSPRPGAGEPAGRALPGDTAVERRAEPEGRRRWRGHADEWRSSGR